VILSGRFKSFLSGQTEPIFTGQTKPGWGGQTETKKGGQTERNVQITLEIMIIRQCWLLQMQLMPATT
jgi:hypothetical protein